MEYQKLEDVSGTYPQYRYIPHNSVLALFAFTGAFGAPCVWALLVATVFLGIVIVFLYAEQAYGDIGVSEWVSPLTLAPAAMLAGKLAVSTGAWPSARRRRPAPTGGLPGVASVSLGAGERLGTAAP